MTGHATIAVVGAGVVGAVTALMLHRAGVDVVVLEQRPPEAVAPTVGTLGEDLRTWALSPASLALLDELDVWDASCRAASCSYHGMEVWDGEGTGRISFTAAEAQVPELGRILPNQVLVTRLWDALAREGILCLDGRTVVAFEAAATRSTLTLDDATTLTAGLVVAADGGDSKMRDLAGIEVDEEDTGQRAIATLAVIRQSHGATAWQRFLPTGPLAFLPLPDRAGQHRVSVVWSLDAEQAAAVEALDDAAFATALDDAIEGRFGGIAAVDRRLGFPLRQRHARRYRSLGLVLVGDAAHVLHPLAGQGVNLGLKDAKVLLHELRPHLRSGRCAALGDPDLLYHYERIRRGENAIMLRAMSGLKRLFGADDLGLRWARNQGLRWVDDLPVVKRELLRQALGRA
ncbi:MAG: FAD-dependent oxidoreductase [Gammaproteobacteria bacterium]|nr:MAG: FAD-dependent oxidoreductase [Gammaproteobacteria bacterium]